MDQAECHCGRYKVAHWTHADTSALQHYSYRLSTMAKKGDPLFSSDFHSSSSNFHSTSSDFHSTSSDFHSTSSDFHSTSSDFHSSSSNFHSTSSDFHSTSSDFHSTSSDFHSTSSDFHSTSFYFWQVTWPSGWMMDSTARDIHCMSFGLREATR